MPKNNLGDSKKQVKNLVKRKDINNANKHQKANEQQAISAANAEIEKVIVNDYIKHRKTQKLAKKYINNIATRKSNIAKKVIHWYSDKDNPKSVIKQAPDINNIKKLEADKTDSTAARLQVLYLCMKNEEKLHIIDEQIEELKKNPDKPNAAQWKKDMTKLEIAKERHLKRLRREESNAGIGQSTVANAPVIPSSSSDNSSAPEQSSDEDESAANNSNDDSSDDSNDDSNDDNPSTNIQKLLDESAKAEHLDNFLMACAKKLRTEARNYPKDRKIFDHLDKYITTQVNNVHNTAPYQDIDAAIVKKTIEAFYKDIRMHNVLPDFDNLEESALHELLKEGKLLVGLRFSISGNLIAPDLLSSTSYNGRIDIYLPNNLFGKQVDLYENAVRLQEYKQKILSATTKEELAELEVNMPEKVTEKESYLHDMILSMIDRRRKALALDLKIAVEDKDNPDIDALVAKTVEKLKKSLNIEKEPEQADNAQKPTQAQYDKVGQVSNAAQQATQLVAEENNISPKYWAEMEKKVYLALLDHYNLKKTVELIQETLAKVEGLDKLTDLVAGANVISTTVGEAGTAVWGGAEALTVASADFTGVIGTVGHVLFAGAGLINVVKAAIAGINSLNADKLEEQLVGAGVDPNLFSEKKGKFKALQKAIKSIGKELAPVIDASQKMVRVQKEHGVIDSQVQGLNSELTKINAAIEEVKKKALPKEKEKEIVEKLEQALQQVKVNLIVAEKNLQKHSHTVMMCIGVAQAAAETCANVCYLLSLFLPPFGTLGAAFTAGKLSAQGVRKLRDAYSQIGKSQEELYNLEVPEYVDMSQRFGKEFYVSSMGVWRKIRHKLHISKTSRQKLVSKLVYSLGLSGQGVANVDLSSVVGQLVSNGLQNKDTDALRDQVNNIIHLNNTNAEDAAEVAFHIYESAGGLKLPYAKTVLGFGAKDIGLNDKKIKDFNREDFTKALDGFKNLNAEVNHDNTKRTVKSLLDALTLEAFDVIYKYFDM